MKQLKLLLFFLTLAFSSVTLAQAVYTTQTGEKYHKSNCQYLKHSKKEIDLKKAISLGYIACKICKPIANNSQGSASKAKIITSKVKTNSSKKTIATQCTAKTQAGKRCKRKTKNSSGRCYQH
ncbi:hypothetical protein [Winogradskyella arenosi]|uniref:Uncharacterized protein n=1 Tax=Winogradskyella arenosi TaxID=533325 RepID=A0A368ZDI5_9FLAO|nr:hypothetical protein [Winogradskyella arenosi]RCW91312.1 hypothetical protein DFQ08_103139 [Winogradskyella arenosi]